MSQSDMQHRAEMRRPAPFVVLHHVFPQRPADSHYDLMLCDIEGYVAPAGTLLTWRIEEWPPSSDAVATLLPPHRASYLRYEGPVSGDRGEVRRVDSGVWHSEQISAAAVRGHLQSETHGACALRLIHEPTDQAGSPATYRVTLEGNDAVRNSGPTGR